MAVQVIDSSEAVSIVVTGDLDLTNIASFQSALTEAFELRDAKRMIIDLQDTDYVDSAGLEQLLTANRKLAAAGDRILVRVREGKQPQTVLAITGFSAVMDVESA